MLILLNNRRAAHRLATRRLSHFACKETIFPRNGSYLKHIMYYPIFHAIVKDAYKLCAFPGCRRRRMASTAVAVCATHWFSTCYKRPFFCLQKMPFYRPKDGLSQHETRPLTMQKTASPLQPATNGTASSQYPIGKKYCPETPNVLKQDIFKAQ